MFYALGAVRVVGFDGDPMQRVTQVVQLLPDINRNEKKLGIMQVMASFKDASNSQLFRQDHIAQLVDRFFLFFALGVLQFLNAIENLAKIAWRIDRDLVTDT